MNWKLGIFLFLSVARADVAVWHIGPNTNGIPTNFPIRVELITPDAWTNGHNEIVTDDSWRWRMFTLSNLSGTLPSSRITGVVNGTNGTNGLNGTSGTNGVNGANGGITNAIAAGGSNAWVGGVVFKSTALFTNLNALSTLSNLASVIVPAHMLTNNGDTVRGEWSIKLPISTANSNRFTIVYGSQTILDTGLQRASNMPVRAWCEITRTGNTAQYAQASLEWGPGGGVPFAFTNVNLELTQTNGINTRLALQGAAMRPGAHTNNFFRLTFEPYTR